MGFKYAPEDFEAAYRKLHLHPVTGTWAGEVPGVEGPCACPMTVLAISLHPDAGIYETFSDLTMRHGTFTEVADALAPFVELSAGEVVDFACGFDDCDQAMYRNSSKGYTEAWNAGTATRLHIEREFGSVRHTPAD
jgi:hypothetical protein